MSRYGTFLCAIGMHNWHCHEVYTPKIDPGYDWPYVYDRICLRCDLEKNKASERKAKKDKKEALILVVEKRLSESKKKFHCGAEEV